MSLEISRFRLDPKSS